MYKRQTYTRITAFGLPLPTFTTGCSNLIRADGSPTYSMLCTLSGAVLNTMLDPLFIFGFDLGIGGGALATVLDVYKRQILPTFRPHWPESAIGPRGRWAPPSTVCVKRAFWPVKRRERSILTARWSPGGSMSGGRA